MEGKILMLCFCNRFREDCGGAPFQTSKKIRMPLEPDEPIASIRTGPQDKIFFSQSFEGLFEMADG